MRLRATNLLIVAMLVVVGVSIAWGIVLSYANGGTTANSLAILLATSAPYAVLGGFIAWRRPEKVMGWMFLSIGLLASTGPLADEYAQYGYVTRPGALPSPVVGVWYAEWYWLPLLFLTFVFTLLLFPSGTLPSPRWRPLLAFAGLSGVVSTTLASLERELELVSGDLAVRNPIGALPINDVEQELAGLPVLLLGISAAGALISLVVRFRRSTGVERQQLKWVAYAATVLVVGFTALGLVDHLTGGRPRFLDALLSILIPLAAGLAILRYRLYDIDRLINRTLVYGVLTAVLVGAYVLCVVGLPSLLGRDARTSQWTVAASTLMVAALFQPMRRHIQDFIDRRFYRSRYDAARTVEAFSERLRHQVTLQALTTDLLRVVGDTVHPAHASLWLRPGERAP